MTHTEQHQPKWQIPFFTIWTGQSLSLIGSQAVQFALIWWLTDRTGSASVLARRKPAEKPPEKPAVKPAVKKTGLLLDLGNENCPIMGKPVNGRTWSEWNGLRVGHCCPSCIQDFLADPEKALDEAGIEWREAAAAVAAIDAASGHERHTLLAETGKKFKVVREE